MRGRVQNRKQQVVRILLRIALRANVQGKLEIFWQRKSPVGRTGPYIMFHEKEFGIPSVVLEVELDPLGQRKFIGIVDGIGLATHVGFPGI